MSSAALTKQRPTPAMTRKLFGTDGIRGTANQAPMTAEIALAVGKAAGADILRVHDVAETAQAIAVWRALHGWAPGG